MSQSRTGVMRSIIWVEKSPFYSYCGYVTEALNAGQTKEVTADRVDMTHDIVEKHYDMAAKTEQMERREDYLKDI
jgi:hypothetical protein